ncbi:hypothetical protein C8R46DRAFT_817147, partial [Mycena filopes]
LSVERLRYRTRYRDTVPREFRLCRLCRAAVEDEVHALFDCVASERLTHVRGRFLVNLAGCDPDLRSLHGQITNYDFLLRLVSSRKGVKCFPKFVWDVLTLFQEVPRYFP